MPTSVILTAIGTTALVAKGAKVAKVSRKMRFRRQRRGGFSGRRGYGRRSGRRRRYNTGREGSDANATSGAEMIAAADATGLPPEMMFALSSKGASGLTILGVNFRADDGMKWRYFDASAFAGISF